MGVISQDVCLELSLRPCVARGWRCLNVMDGTFQVGQDVCLKPVGTSYSSRREERLNVVVWRVWEFLRVPDAAPR